MNWEGGTSPRWLSDQQASAVEPDHSPRTQVDDGLEDKGDPTVCERGLEGFLDLETVHDRRVHAGLVEDMATSAFTFRFIHGEIGVAQQRLGRIPWPDDGDADAGTDGQAVPLELHRRLAQGVDHSIGQRRHLLDGHIFDQHGELITADARSRVPAAGATPEVLCGRQRSLRRHRHGRNCR